MLFDLLGGFLPFLLMKENQKRYSAHSHTEHEDFDTMDEALSVATSMAEVFGSSYIIDNITGKVIETY